MQEDKIVKRPKILEELEKIAAILPAPIYWEDINSVVLGANEHILKGIGASRDTVMGKTLYEFYPYEIAEKIVKHNEEVIKTGKILGQEESIKDVTTGEIKYFTAIKAPLYDENGKVIGIVGTSIDITAEKEAQRLKLENEVHKNSLAEQAKFTKIADQVAHDIRSPLASLMMIVKSCAEIPEKERIALREVASRIQDIANNLLSQYKPKDADAVIEKEERQSVLCSATLLQLLTEKRYQYQDLLIKIDYDFNQAGHFAFIKSEPSAFKRMVSNLINNAVDSFDEKEGRIMLKLEADTEWVRITVEDNGKGMAVDLVNKIMQNVAITTGKSEGHGIGLTQVRETLQRNEGRLVIDSKPGIGTKMRVTFARVKAPAWIAEEINLGADDIVVVLDDDASIHGAWDAHFEPVLEATPTIEVKHFEMGQEALDFINGLSPEKKQKVFLLTDYELLRQDINGLDVIEKSQLDRSILVTSHYANQSIRAHAAKQGTRILPKQMASEIPIYITPVMSAALSTECVKDENKVDIVIVEDDEFFAQGLIDYLDHKKIDYYQNPYTFLENLAEYPKETMISLDNDFKIDGINGLSLAQQLHEQGYTNLYLLSGKDFEPHEIPPYLKFIMKMELDLDSFGN